MKKESSSLAKNYNIQALRAIAALFVVFDHTITQFNIYYSIPGFFGNVLKNIEGIGTVGVYIFFIVSGYIMSFTTFNKKWDKKESWIFLKKRVLRIYPTYWVWLTILLVVWYLGFALKQHDYSMLKIVSSYLLLPYSDDIPSKINPVLGQGWTLIFEMFYYLFFTAMIFFNIKKSYAIIVSFIFFTLVIVLGTTSFSPFSSLNFFMSSKLFYFFIAGMIIYKLEGEILKFQKFNFFAIFLFLICTVSLCLIVLSNPGLFYSKGLMVILGLSFFLLVFIKGSGLKRLKILGDASYSLYLSHSFIVMAYGVICKKFSFSMPVLFVFGVMTIIISLLVGVVSYYLVEVKIQRFLNSKFVSTKKVMPSTS